MRREPLPAAAWPLAVLALAALWVAWTPPLRAAALRLAPLGSATLFAAAFVGLGAPLARRLLPGACRLDQILVSGAVGVGLTGLFTFLPGVMGVVDPALYVAWTLAGLGLLAWVVLRHWGREPLPGIPTDALSTVALLVAAVTLLLQVPLLVAPVASTDAMEYHLMIPRLALAAGRIEPLPSLVESGYPSLAPWTYLLVLPLAGDVACKGLHFWAGIGLLLALGRLVARAAPEANRLLAPALYLTMPVAAGLFAVAWNDNLFVFLCLLALGQMLDYDRDPRAVGAVRHAVAAGILLGLAAWTKYTIVMILLALAPLILWALARRRWRPVHVVVLAVPVGMLSLLVFVKNAVFTGNPFYPFLHGLFPSPYWNDTSAAYFHDALRRWEIREWRWHTWLTFPYHLVLRPRLIDIHTGILPLAAIPFIFGGGGTTSRGLLKGFLLANLLAWYLIQTETRSLLTLLAVLFAVAAPAMEAHLFRPRRIRRAALFALGIAALASVLLVAFNALVLTRPLGYLFGLEGRREFLRREVKHYRVLEWLNADPGVRGVLLVGMKRPYHVEKPAWFSAFADRPIAEVLLGDRKDPGALARDLLALGITHVAVDTREYRKDHEEGLYGWGEAGRAVFEGFLARECEPVVRIGDVVVYRIVAPPAAARRRDSG